MGPPRVAIVGAGITGPAAALLLARNGHPVTLFEKRPAPNRCGTGLLVQPAGLDVLEEIGLRRTLESHGARVERICRRSSDGKTYELRYAELEHGLYGLGIHRAVLCTKLLEAARAVSAEVCCPVDIVDVREDVHGVRLTDAAGHGYGPFDVLAICDGAYSRLRQRTSLRSWIEPCAWGVFSAVTHRPSALDAELLLQRQRRAEEFVGLLPTGSTLEGGDLITFFWNARVADRSRVIAQDFSFWRSRIEEFCPESRDVLAELTGFDQLAFSTYTEVRMERWHTGRIVVMGDAAHALNPQLGMGANLGLVDAATLAACLQQVDASSIATALREYQRRRDRQLSFYRTVSRTLAPLIQGDSPLPEMLLRICARLPRARREVVKAVCGYAGI